MLAMEHMQKTARIVLFAMALIFAGGRVAGAAEFSVMIVDGLGRPVREVSVEVFHLKRDTNSNVERIALAKVMSDTNGFARGEYSQNGFGTNDSLAVSLSKTGYAGYTGGPESEYVLRRLFKDDDVARIAKLAGETQKQELRELLAGEFGPTAGDLNELIFVKSNRLRPALRSLVDDSWVGLKAGELLAFMGVPDDMRYLVQNAPSPRRDPAANRWAYRVVSSLIEPPSEREWAYLKRCAQDEFRDHWVDVAAIRTLRLNGTTRAGDVLKDVRKQNSSRTNDVEGVIAYIQSKPAPLEDKDVGMAGKKVAQALGLENWRGNQPARYNDERDMALVECEFLTGRQLVVYTATFQKAGDLWKLRGVRDTRQAVLPRTAGGTAAEEKK
jgi:hypothetical protein